MHLITHEALGIYLKHMKPDGIIAFHVTNRFLDLPPVVAALARERNLETLWVADDGAGPLASRSDWILLSRNGTRLKHAQLVEAEQPLAPREGWRLWTDDFNNHVQVLK